MEIKEHVIIAILKNRNTMLRTQQLKKQDIFKEFELAEDEMIQMLSLKGRSVGDTSPSGQGASQGLDKILEGLMIKKRQYFQELSRRMELIEQDEDMIHRVWVCYQCLPTDQYIILKRLYVDGEPWKSIEIDRGINHNTLVKVRKIAVRNIQQMYASDHTNVQLAEYKAYHALPQKKQKKINLQLPGQLSLELSEEQKEDKE